MMKVHKETIDALIGLYNNGQRILKEEQGTSMDNEEAMEAAAIDYMMSDAHVQFRSIVDNLDVEVCRELVALLLLGRDQNKYSGADFDHLKNGAQTGAAAGDYLFGQKRLPEYWRAALDMMDGQSTNAILP